MNAAIGKPNAMAAKPMSPKASPDKEPVNDGINAGKGKGKDGWDHIGKEGFCF